MLRRIYTIILAVTLLFTTISFSQSYQGPAIGTVNSGVVVTTNNLLSRSIGNLNFSNPVIRNTDFFQNPIYIEGDIKFLDNYIYVEDKNVSGNMVSSGIYFYELKANGISGKQFNQVKKMILMK